MAIDMNIKELLVIGDSDMLIHQVQGEWSTKNVKILSYLHCVKELCKKFTKIELRHVPRIQNEFVGALATLSSMIQHPHKNYIDPIKVEIKYQRAYFFHVDEEPDGYRTTMRTSIGVMPYMLVYGTEAVIPAEVKIPSLRVIQEAKLDGGEWIWVRKEQLMLIDEKRINAVQQGVKNRWDHIRENDGPATFLRLSLILLL
ncbi:uncharacterized protein [Nicotiana tomentosiformis]|uniref:uncharacterized protein n=1 Tax=Nicotiana tomentosiformis TaxID=4098 RepID=UPI00388C5F75